MVAVHEADGLRFTSAFEDLGGTFEREVFDECDAIAVRKHVAVGILDDAGFLGFFRLFPLVAAGHAFPAFDVFQNIVHLAHRAGRFAH